MLKWITPNSASVNGKLIRAIQSSGRATGQSDNSHGSFALDQGYNLPHLQPSARFTRPHSKGIALDVSAEGKKVPVILDGKLLNRT